MKTKVNMGRAGGPKDFYVGPEEIAILILKRFLEMIPPEPPSLVTKRIMVTFEEVRAQVTIRSGLEADGNNDPDEEIFRACEIMTQRYPHMFQFAPCKKTQVQNQFITEIGLQYTALRLS